MSQAPLAGHVAPPSAWHMIRSMVGVGFLCGLIIVSVFQATEPVIERNKAEALRRAIFRVLPEARSSATFRYSREERFESQDSAAKGEMLEIGSREQQLLLANRSYTNDPNDFAYELPADVAAKYSFSISTFSGSAVPAFAITFTAIGSQVDDGDLTLNSEGVKTPADKWAR